MYGICSTGQVGHGPGVVVIDPAKQPQGKEEQEAQKAQIKTILKGWDAMLAATVKPTEAEYAKQRQQFEAMWEAAASREVSMQCTSRRRGEECPSRTNCCQQHART